MEDAMKPFYTGWNSGDALAQTDNARYTQYGNTALSNTGTQNHEMLQHVNKLHQMLLTGIGPTGQPLSPADRRAIGDFVNATQEAFSQGVYTPAPYTPKADPMPVFGRGAAPIAPPLPTASTDLPPMLATPDKLPLELPTYNPEQRIIPDDLMPRQPPVTDAPAPKVTAPTAPKKKYTAPVPKRKAIIKKAVPSFLTNQGIQPLGKWNGGF